MTTNGANNTSSWSSLFTRKKKLTITGLILLIGIIAIVLFGVVRQSTGSKTMEGLVDEMVTSFMQGNVYDALIGNHHLNVKQEFLDEIGMTDEQARSAFSGTSNNSESNTSDGMINPSISLDIAGYLDEQLGHGWKYKYEIVDLFSLSQSNSNFNDIQEMGVSISSANQVVVWVTISDTTSDSDLGGQLSFLVYQSNNRWYGGLDIDSLDFSSWF